MTEGEDEKQVTTNGISSGAVHFSPLGATVQLFLVQ